MSFINNSSSFQRDDSPFRKGIHNLDSNPDLINCDGFISYSSQPTPAKFSCHKRVAFTYNEDEEKLVKKIKSMNHSGVPVPNNKNQQGFPQSELNFASVDFSKILADNQLNIVENPAKDQNIIKSGSVQAPESTILPSENPSETRSDVIIIPDNDEPVIEIDNERVNYRELFQKMHDNLVLGFQRQLEFLKILKEMNSPQYTMRWPILEKINPMIAGVMQRKSKIDVNTVRVMKRAHRLLQSDTKMNKKNKNSSQSIDPQEDQMVVDQLMKFILNEDDDEESQSKQNGL